MRPGDPAAVMRAAASTDLRVGIFPRRMGLNLRRWFFKTTSVINFFLYLRVGGHATGGKVTRPHSQTRVKGHRRTAPTLCCFAQGTPPQYVRGVR